MKPRYRLIQRTLAAALCAALIHHASAATQYIDLGGPATGYLGVSNFKNSTSQNGIEGKNEDGTPNPGHNGLPDYPNYQIPTGQLNAGVWTAVIVSPQFAGADYSPFYAYGGVGAGDVAVNNLITTDTSHSTMSAGLIGFDDSFVTGFGLEVIPVSALTFNFNTYGWYGVTGGDHGGWPVTSPMYISPFSPIYTDYNDGSGAGNASLIYNLSLSNVTGTGLLFQDGQLVSMDIAGDLTVLARAGYIFGPSITFTGGFSASGLNYAFDVDDIQSGFVWSGIHMVMNREGTASVVPEPSSALLLSLGVVAFAARRRRAATSRTP